MTAGNQRGPPGASASRYTVSRPRRLTLAKTTRRPAFYDNVQRHLLRRANPLQREAMEQVSRTEIVPPAVATGRDADVGAGDEVGPAEPRPRHDGQGRRRGVGRAAGRLRGRISRHQQHRLRARRPSVLQQQRAREDAERQRLDDGPGGGLAHREGGDATSPVKPSHFTSAPVASCATCPSASGSCWWPTTRGSRAFWACPGSSSCGTSRRQRDSDSVPGQIPNMQRSIQAPGSHASWYR